MREDFFSASYGEAREKFLAAAGAAGAAIESVRAPRVGPGGEPLHMDVATIGAADAPRRIVISSGLHGVEGFCGSACQIALMRSGATVGGLAADTSLVLVHALNPFGFAWVRRFNEDNIDLNRNFLDDFSRPPGNPRFREISAALAAGPADAASWSRANRELADYASRHGEAAFVEAATGGQYEDAGAIFYGGVAPAWTQVTWVALARRLLAGARAAILFDIHTGIGAYGERLAWCQTAPEDPRVAIAARLFGEAVRTPARGPEGGRARRGLMLPCLDGLRLAPLVLPLGVEFGTFPLAATLEAVRAENWLFHHGDRDTPEGRRIVARLRDAFAPTDSDWEMAVIAKSAEMFRHVIAGFAAMELDGTG